MPQQLVSPHDIQAINKLAAIIVFWGKQPQIRKIAVDIVNDKNPNGTWRLDENDHIKEIKSVYDWVNKNVRYTKDPNKIDIFEDPLLTLELKIADCDGYLILIGSLLQAIGYPVAVAMTSQSKIEALSHVYLLVGNPPSRPPKAIGEWIPVDAITNNPITWQPPYAYGIYRKV